MHPREVDTSECNDYLFLHEVVYIYDPQWVCTSKVYSTVLSGSI